jgi:hypothetical protein
MEVYVHSRPRMNDHEQTLVCYIDSRYKNIQDTISKDGKNKMLGWEKQCWLHQNISGASI